MLLIPDHVNKLASRELEIACEAALQAGQIIYHAWNNQPTDFKEKDGHYDLVSVVDEQADTAIQSIIKNAFPEDRIISEELSPDFDSWAMKGRVWICDPLDGTASFLFKTDPVSPCVMIALIVDGFTQLSVILQPMIARWTYAVKGQGAFVNCEKVRVNSGSNLSQGWVDLNQYGDAEFESDWFKRIDRFVRGKNGARLVTRSSPHSAIALRLLRPITDNSVARGLAACMHDHNPNKPKQLPWDIVPVKLIIEEAGGEYIDVSRGLKTGLDPFNLEGPILIGARSTLEYIINSA
jgi:myo-inositol-1(or 4)-monophosphatase